MLPDLIIQHGMMAVVLWTIGVLVVAFPFLSLGLTMSFTLRGSPAKNLRRIHRPFAALGVLQTAVTFLVGILLVVVSTWAFTVLADIIIDLVSGRGSRLGQGIDEIRQHWIVVIGFSDLESMSAGHLGSPLGGLLIVAVLLWLVIHQVLNTEQFYFRGVIQIALVIFLVLLGGLCLSVVGNRLPLFLSPAGGSSPESPQGLYPLGMLSDVLSVVLLSGALGTGFIGQMLMQDGRSRDSLASLAVSLVSMVVLAVGWLILAGVGYAQFNFMHLEGYLSSASSIDVLLLQIPIGIYLAGGGGAWGVLLTLLFLLFTGLVSLIAALLFLRSSSIQLQRDFALPLHEIQTRLITAGMLCTLPFCTQGGVGLWLAVIDGIRLILLPAMLLWLWWGVTLHLGFSGFVDYMRTTSAIPMVRWWNAYVRVAIPFILLLYLIGSALILSGGYALPSLWNPLLTLTPLIALIMYGWWYYKRGSSE